MNRKQRRKRDAIKRRAAPVAMRDANREITKLKGRLQKAILTAIDGKPFDGGTVALISRAVDATLPPLPVPQLEPLPSTPEEREARTIRFQVTGEAAKRINDLLPDPESHHCQIDPFSSRTCERGTHSCKVRHEDAEAAHTLKSGAGDYTRS